MKTDTTDLPEIEYLFSGAGKTSRWVIFVLFIRTLTLKEYLALFFRETCAYDWLWGEDNVDRGNSGNKTGGNLGLQR